MIKVQPKGLLSLLVIATLAVVPSASHLLLLFPLNDATASVADIK